MIGTVEGLFDLEVGAAVYCASGVYTARKSSEVSQSTSFMSIKKNDGLRRQSILTISAEPQILLRPRDVMSRPVAIADIAFDVFVKPRC